MTQMDELRDSITTYKNIYGRKPTTFRMSPGYLVGLIVTHEKLLLASLERQVEEFNERQEVIFKERWDSRSTRTKILDWFFDVPITSAKLEDPKVHLPLPDFGTMTNIPVSIFGVKIEVDSTLDTFEVV